MKRLAAIILITLSLASCTFDQQYQYYSDTSHYVTATGRVTHIKYSEEMDALYLGIEDLSPAFADNSFKIVGENLLIAQENGIDQKLQPGETVEFISAPRYFGDGYVMPIVGIIVDGEALLTFEEGYSNWLEWIK